MRPSLKRPAAYTALSFVLLAVLPGAAESPRLRCVPDSIGSDWQQLAVPSFGGTDGVIGPDRVTGYAVQTARPERQLVTNGKAMLSTTSDGCLWHPVFQLAAPRGVTDTVEQLALLPSGAGVAVTDSAVQPVLISSDATAATWRAGGQGLPPGATAGPLAVTSDGTLILAAETGVGSVLYRSEDGGATWAPDIALPQRDYDLLVAAPDDPRVLFGLSGSRLFVSRDGGLSFEASVEQVRTIATGEGGKLWVFRGNQVLSSTDAGKSFSTPVATGAVLEAAARPGDPLLTVRTPLGLARLDPSTGQLARSPAPTPTEQTLTASAGPTPTFHAAAGRAVLRYRDPRPDDPAVSVPDASTVVGDLVPPRPRSGTLHPAMTRVTLPVGADTTVRYRLALPATPSPLDVFYLLDTSPSMQPQIDALRRQVAAVSRSLADKGVDLRQGVGVLTTGPAKGDPPYPELEARPPGEQPYRKPVMYARLQPVRPAGAGLAAALAAVEPETPPAAAPGPIVEAQLLALDQAATGTGVLDPAVPLAARRYVVPAGQQASFRPGPQVRRVIVLATDDPFVDGGRYPAGSPERDGRLDVAGVAERLRDAGIVVVGYAGGSERALFDLSTMARDTGALAARPVSCGGTTIPAGRPLACPDGDLGALVAGALLAVPDIQQVQVLADAPVRLTSAANVDVSAPSIVTAEVALQCRTPGARSIAVRGVLRETVVGSASIALTCVPPVPDIAPPEPAAPQVDLDVEGQDPAGATSAVLPGSAPAPPAPANGTAAQANVQPQGHPQAQAGLSRNEQQAPELVLADVNVDDQSSSALGLLAAEVTLTAAAGAYAFRRRSRTAVARASAYR